MIFKFYNIGVFVFLLVGLSCCSITKTSLNFVKDIDGYPIAERIDSTEVYYVKKEGEKLVSYFRGVEFNGGCDSLSAYLNDVYYNHPSYNYEEYYMLSIFFILFDKNLNIVEVRIMKRPHNEKFYYDSILIVALKNTTGMWHKTVEDKEWYTYLHRQRIY